MERAGGGWCPKQQVERGVREYLQVDLEEIHVITGIQTQGRYDRGRGQEYAEEYTLEYWRPGLQEWKEYKRWDGKQVRYMTGKINIRVPIRFERVFLASDGCLQGAQGQVILHEYI